MLAKHPPKANPNRGPVKPQDIKKTVDFGSTTDDLVDNTSVLEERLPGLRAFIENFYEKAFKTELQILSALAIALGVPESHLTSLHNRAENEFRILHYPAIPASELSDGMEPNWDMNAEAVLAGQ